MNPLILGAGPVGLLCAHVLRAPCLGERPGGDERLRRLAPSILWYTPALERIIRDVDLPPDVTEVKFGFLGPRGVTQDVTPEERAEYLRRSGRDPATAPASAVSSGASGCISAFRVTVEELTRALLLRVEVIQSRVVKLIPDVENARTCVVTSSGLLHSDRVFNTLPAPVFDQLLGAYSTSGRVWDVGRKWFAEGAAWDDSLEVARASGLRWLYVTDPRIPFDRVTFSERWATYEFNVEPQRWFVGCIPSWTGEVIGPLPLQVRGEVRSAEEFFGLVRHVGRMARWDHRIRLHDVAEEISSGL